MDSYNKQNLQNTSEKRSWPYSKKHYPKDNPPPQRTTTDLVPSQENIVIQRWSPMLQLLREKQNMDPQFKMWQTQDKRNDYI